MKAIAIQISTNERGRYIARVRRNYGTCYKEGYILATIIVEEISNLTGEPIPIMYPDWFIEKGLENHTIIKSYESLEQIMAVIARFRRMHQDLEVTI